MDKNEHLQSALDKVLTWVATHKPATITNFVDKCRADNPSLTNEELAKKIISRQSLKSGLIGAIISVGGLPTLPIAVPANLIASWRIQAFIAFTIAYIYGHTPDNSDLKTDLYIILAGDAAKEALKLLGIEVGKHVTRKAVDKYITKAVMVKIWKYLSQKIITKAGEKSLTSFMRLVPLVGAPIGFTVDWLAARTVGKMAICYYSP